MYIALNVLTNKFISSFQKNDHNSIHKNTTKIPKIRSLKPSYEPSIEQQEEEEEEEEKEEKEEKKPITQKKENEVNPKSETINMSTQPSTSELQMNKVQKLTEKAKLSASLNPKIRHSGLKCNPLSSGVKNATSRFELPVPAIAARNLVEKAHYAHLCTVMSNKHHKRAGYPFGTLVDFAVDGAGYPIISVLSLAVPTRNIIEDSRCSLVVQMPGWSGLANARLTIFGDVFQLPPEIAVYAPDMFQSQSMQQKIVTGNTLFFRMHQIKDIYFVGGFGTVQWIDVKDYVNAEPDHIVISMGTEDLQSINEMYGDDLCLLFSSEEKNVDEARIISIDALGADIRLRSGTEFNVVRFGFSAKISTMAEMRSALNDAIHST